MRSNLLLPGKLSPLLDQTGDGLRAAAVDRDLLQYLDLFVDHMQKALWCISGSAGHRPVFLQRVPRQHYALCVGLFAHVRSIAERAASVNPVRRVI